MRIDGAVSFGRNFYRHSDPIYFLLRLTLCSPKNGLLVTITAQLIILYALVWWRIKELRLQFKLTPW